MTTLYHNIDILITPGELLQNASLLVEGDTIKAINPRTPELISEGEAAWLKVDCRGKMAMPGLKNGHAHSAMTLLRGYADDMKLQPWLTEKIWPLEALLTGEDIYHGIRLACLEMIKSGTTFCNDMYFQTPFAWKAYREMGIRAATGSAIIDFLDPSRAEDEKRRVEEEIARFGPGGEEKDPSEKVTLTIAPHALYTVSAETLQWASEKAQDHGMALHIHLSETEQEVAECLKANGKRPAAWLDARGVLGPHCIAAHGIWLDNDELDLLAERKVTVVHNPASNMKTSAGSCFPYREYRRRGIGMMLGTDGCASNNALDLFSDARLAGLLQKHHSGDPTILPASELTDLLTGAAARPDSDSGVGPFRTLSGRVEPGAPADFILLDLSNPRMAPMHSPLSNIAYAADGGCVDTVVCGGKVLMAGGEVPGEKAIVAEAAEAAQRLVSRRSISSTL